MPNRILRDYTDSYRFEHLSAEGERLFNRLIQKADDFGRFSADVRFIRSGCFPLLTSIRDSDISRWLAECQKAGLIAVYVVQGRSYLAIIDFRQRLRTKSGKFPPMDGQPSDWEPTHDGQLTVNCQTDDGLKGREEEVEEEGEGGKPPSPLAILTGAWDGIGLAKVVQMSDTRRKHANARLGEPFWRDNYPAGLSRIAASGFCLGDNDRGWKADFDWFIQPNTLAKILEGKYDNKPKAPLHPVTGRPIKQNGTHPN